MSAPATGTSGPAVFPTSRNSSFVAQESAGPNRLDLSPVYEGSANGGALAVSPTSSPAAQRPVSSGLGCAAARQVLLPPRTPHAATGRAGCGSVSARGSATGTAAVSAAGVDIVPAPVGGIAMETPRSGTAGPRVRGGFRGHGHGGVDDGWSDDDPNHSGGSSGGGGRGRGSHIGQPNGSWGGCSTIKRTAEEMVGHTHAVSTVCGGRGIGVANGGSADHDGHFVCRGFPNASRMSSSSTASSLSSGSEFPLRSTRGVAGGGGGGSGARESYGRGGSLSNRSGGGGGRVDYHSLCFSSSSSGYSASSSSPFGLLDRDSTTSEN